MDNREKEKLIEEKRRNLVLAFCPPVIYVLVTMIVQVVFDVSIFLKNIKNINGHGRANFYDSYYFMDNLEENMAEYGYIVTVISALLGGIFFGLWYRKNRNQENSDKFEKELWILKSEEYGMLAILGVVGGLGLGRFVSILSIDNILGSYKETSENLMRGSVSLQILTLAIIVPIAEELIYRGISFGKLRKIMSPGYATIAVSALFGLFHFNLMQGTYAFLLSLILVCVYLRYDSITAPIVVHGTANLMAVILNGSEVQKKINENMVAYLLVMFVELALGYIVFQLIMEGKQEKNQKAKKNKKKY